MTKAKVKYTYMTAMYRPYRSSARGITRGSNTGNVGIIWPAWSPYGRWT